MELLKRRILLVAVIAAPAIFLGISLASFLEKTGGQNPVQIPLPTPTAEIPAPRVIGSAFKTSGGLPVLPLPKPDIDALRKERSISEPMLLTLEKIKQAVEIVERKVEAENKIPQTALSPSPASDALPVTPAPALPPQREIALDVTREEFEFLYPQKFLEALRDGAQAFIREQDPFYRPVTRVENDADVRFIEENLVHALLKANIYTPKDAERAITSIRFTIPQLQLSSLAGRKAAESSSDDPLVRLTNGLRIVSRVPQIIETIFTAVDPERARKIQLARGPFLSELLQDAQSSFIPGARAACGECHSRGPLCFEFGAGTPGVPGRFLFLPMCECTGCLSALGCVSFCRPAASLYDEMTRACGCGT